MSRTAAEDAALREAEARMGRQLLTAGLVAPAQLNEALRMKDQLSRRGVGLTLEEVLVGQWVLTSLQLRTAMAASPGAPAAPSAPLPPLPTPAPPARSGAPTAPTAAAAAAPVPGPLPVSRTPSGIARAPVARPATPRPASTSKTPSGVGRAAGPAAPAPAHTPRGTDTPQVAAPPASPGATPTLCPPGAAGRPAARRPTQVFHMPPHDATAGGPHAPPGAGATPASGEPPSSKAPPTPAAAGESTAGEPFGRYRLLSEVGRGGMGVVYKAWDGELKRVVALKTLLPEATPSELDVQRFLREARASARLRHPNIVQVHEVSAFEGVQYFTMDFIDGESFAVAKKRFPTRRFLEVLRDVAHALHAAHEAGVIHRDVKPGNVLLDGTGRPYVTDFGLAKEVKEGKGRSFSTSGALLGTPHYMSAEQAEGRLGEVGPWSDVWSLGVILYEHLAGRMPFEADNLLDVLLAIVQSEPEPPSRVAVRQRSRRQVPEDLETIALRCLEKNTRRRYRSAKELAEELERFLAGEPILAKPASRWAALGRAARKHTAAVVAASVLAVAALGFWLWAAEGAARRTQAVAEALRLGREEEEAAGAATGVEAARRLEAAAAAFDRAKKIDSDSAEAQAGMDRITARLREVEEARKGATEKEASDRERRRQAAELLERGREALKHAEQRAREKDATHAAVAGKAEEALRSIDAAVGKAPDDAAALYEQGRALALLGRADRAEAAWRKAAGLAPDLAIVRLGLGRLLIARACGAEAAAPDGAEGAARVDTARLGAEAAIQFRAALATRQALDDPLQREIAAAAAAYLASDAERVQAVTRAALERFGSLDGVECLHWLAGLSLPPERARICFDRALAIHPNFREALLARGLALRRLGDKPRAAADYARVLELSPPDAPARAALQAVLDALRPGGGR
ncbi:MAG: protein kinase [Planctomycetes bacterium]|nr:protein kinase [Planctomycetota bacterium]